MSYPPELSCNPCLINTFESCMYYFGTRGIEFKNYFTFCNNQKFVVKIIHPYCWLVQDRKKNCCIKIELQVQSLHYYSFWTSWRRCLSHERIRGRSKTTLARFQLFWPPTPLCWHFLWWKRWQKVDILGPPIYLVL